MVSQKKDSGKDLYFLVIGLFLCAFGLLWNKLVVGITARFVGHNFKVLKTGQYDLLLILLGLYFFFCFLVLKARILAGLEKVFIKLKYSKHRKVLFWTFILFIILVIYGPTVNWFFANEDFMELNHDKNINGNNFLNQFVPKDPQTYYPLTQLIWHLNLKLFGLNPVYFHIQEIVLFVIFIILMHALLKYIFKNDLIIYGTLILTLLNASYFIHVAWIASSNLWILNPIPSLLCFFKFRETKKSKYFALSLLFLIIGIFIHPWIVIVPPILFLYDLLIKRSLNFNWKTEFAKYHLAFWIIISFYITAKLIITPINVDPYKINFGFNILTNYAIYLLYSFNVPFAEYLNGFSLFLLTKFPVLSIIISSIFIFINYHIVKFIIGIDDIENRKQFIFFYLWFPINIAPLLLIKTGGHLAEYHLARSVVGLNALLILTFLINKKRKNYKATKFILVITGLLIIFSIHRFNYKIENDNVSKYSFLAENITEQFVALKSQLDMKNQLIIITDDLKEAENINSISYDGYLFRLFYGINNINIIYKKDANFLLYKRDRSQHSVFSNKEVDSAKKQNYALHFSNNKLKIY
jgi:hypothetical protein